MILSQRQRMLSGLFLIFQRGSDSLRERCITNLKLYEVKNGVKEPDKDAFKNLIDYLDRSTPINSSTLLNKPPKPPTPDYGNTDM